MALVELCVALEPSEETLKALLKLTSACFRDDSASLIRVDEGRDKLSFAPHLTLYQFAIPVASLDNVCAVLLELGRSVDAGEIIATANNLILSHREKDAAPKAVEIMYAKDTNTSSLSLLGLQARVVTALNLFRDGSLIEKDPTGVPLTEQVNNDNVAEYGWAEGIQQFNPHVTLGWVDANSSIDLPKFEGRGDVHTFKALSLYILGPLGTCVQKLYSIPLPGCQHPKSSTQEKNNGA